MLANIEIKAKVSDMETLRALAQSLTNAAPEVLHQEDIFFGTLNGRLKLRIFGDGKGELIQYNRRDARGSKQSDYQIHEVDDPETLRSVLGAALGEVIQVKKKREVHWVGQTRVHLDEVDDLGSFMELEVVLKPGQSAREGEAIVAGLMEQLRIHEEDLVAGAYADLLREQAAPKSKAFESL